MQARSQPRCDAGTHYGTTSGGPYPSVKSSAATSTNITGLTNGTPCYFVI